MDVAALAAYRRAVRGVWIGAGVVVAVGLAGIALGGLRRDAPARPTTDAPEPAKVAPSADRGQVPNRGSTPQNTPSSIRPPVGLQLSAEDTPGRHSTAQAIVDDALLQLRRLEGADPAVAREIYMRGSAALERVDDELDPDDEPGRAKLRADTEALRGEMARLFDVNP